MTHAYYVMYSVTQLRSPYTFEELKVHYKANCWYGNESAFIEWHP